MKLAPHSAGVGIAPDDDEDVDPALLAELEEMRPTTRGDCLAGGRNGSRPCIFVGCRHHVHELFTPAGNLRPDVEPLDLVDSCVLDIVDREPDGMFLDEVGAVFGLTRERIRQVEKKALKRLHMKARGLDDGPRALPPRATTLALPPRREETPEAVVEDPRAPQLDLEVETLAALALRFDAPDYTPPLDETARGAEASPPSPCSTCNKRPVCHKPCAELARLIPVEELVVWREVGYEPAWVDFLGSVHGPLVEPAPSEEEADHHAQLEAERHAFVVEHRPALQAAVAMLPDLQQEMTRLLQGERAIDICRAKKCSKPTVSIARRRAIVNLRRELVEKPNRAQPVKAKLLPARVTPKKLPSRKRMNELPAKPKRAVWARDSVPVAPVPPPTVTPTTAPPPRKPITPAPHPTATAAPPRSTPMSEPATTSTPAAAFTAILVTLGEQLDQHLTRVRRLLVDCPAGAEDGVDQLLERLVHARRAADDVIIAALRSSRSTRNPGQSPPPPARVDSTLAGTPTPAPTPAPASGCDKAKTGGCTGPVSTRSCPFPGCSHTTARCESHGGLPSASRSLGGHTSNAHRETSAKPKPEAGAVRMPADGLL